MSAAIPKSLAEQGRRSSSSSQRASGISHGRGGAGNMGYNPSDNDPVTLETPTIKTDVYTTGRGGSGNMAKNTDPAEARRAQDVVGHPRRESNASQHVGRGGAANVFHPTREELEQAKRQGESAVEDSNQEQYKGLADKGKEWLRAKMNKA